MFYRRKKVVQDWNDMIRVTEEVLCWNILWKFIFFLRGEQKGKQTHALKGLKTLNTSLTATLSVLWRGLMLFNVVQNVNSHKSMCWRLLRRWYRTSVSWRMLSCSFNASALITSDTYRTCHWLFLFTTILELYDLRDAEIAESSHKKEFTV